MTTEEDRLRILYLETKIKDTENRARRQVTEKYEKKLREIRRGLRLIFIGTLISGLLGLAAGYYKHYREREADRGITIQDRISKLTSSLTDATDIISKIETEIDSRRTLVQQLESDAKVATSLSETNRDQLNAVVSVLRGELAREERSSFWWSVGQNVLFMFIGAFLSHFVERFMRRSNLE